MIRIGRLVLGNLEIIVWGGGFANGGGNGLGVVFYPPGVAPGDFSIGFDQGDQDFVGGRAACSKSSLRNKFNILTSNILTWKIV